MRATTPEAAIQRAICDLLTAERVWWCRMNTGTQVLEGANGKRRVFRAGRPGMADLLATPRFLSVSLPWWIEVKTATGRQSPAQKAFQAEVEAVGHTYLLVRSSDEVLAWLRDYGVVR